MTAARCVERSRLRAKDFKAPLPRQYTWRGRQQSNAARHREAKNALLIGKDVRAVAARVLLRAALHTVRRRQDRRFAGPAAFMSGVGLPAAKALLVLTIALEIGAACCSSSVAGALGGDGLLRFIFLTAMIVNTVLNSDAAVYLSQLNHFMKNLALMGGMLYVRAYGAGR